MIPCCEPPVQSSGWPLAQKDYISSVSQLEKEFPDLAAHCTLSTAASALFALRLPRRYCERLLQLADPGPLLQQFLPQAEETVLQEGFQTDPLGEEAANKLPGLIHKYHNRVLLSTTQACAVHCRYCFRRHFPYHENNPGRSGWQRVFAYIDAHVEIHEAILSGGDPLSLSDTHLAWFLDQLERIPHLQTIRLHTRLPTILPERLRSMVSVLQARRCQIVLVLHVNHPAELDDSLADLLAPLKAQGITLLNQSVLLRHVNDSLEVLERLSINLFRLGILPYYLHQMDLVAGTHHFCVPNSEAIDLHRQLQGRLSGYLVPKLVREVAGEPHKVCL